jgi:hypothetical protein
MGRGRKNAYACPLGNGWMWFFEQLWFCLWVGELKRIEMESGIKKASLRGLLLFSHLD